MKHLASILILGILASGIPIVVRSQEVSLVEMKKREEERRKKTEKSKQTIDDSNLSQSGSSGKPSGFVQAQSTGATTATEQTKPDENRKTGLVPANYPTTEETWKNQKRNFEQRIKQLEDAIKKSDDRIKQLWNEFYLKDIPAEQARIKADISMVSNQVNTDKANLETLKAEYTQFLNNARKASIPPGWSRDR